MQVYTLLMPYCNFDFVVIVMLCVVVVAEHMHWHTQHWQHIEKQIDAHISAQVDAHVNT